MLAELETLMQDCKKCPLHENRNRLVFGQGNPNSNLVLAGEAPGEEENETGLPFQGKAGKQLDKILEFINVPRENIYILNTVCCRPPNNRVPLPEETNACKPRLHLQLNLIRPSLIVALGRSALTSLLGEFKGNLNQFFDRDDLFIQINNNKIKVVSTFHPSALLRRPSLKQDAKNHWIKIKELYMKSLTEDVIL